MFLIPPNHMNKGECEIYVLIYCAILFLTPVIVLLYTLAKAFSDHKRWNCCAPLVSAAATV